MRTTTASLRFLGAAGTVTGSKHLVAVHGQQILLDCGLFQGLKTLRERNRSEPPVDPTAVDAVVLSHAHLDHSGYLPVLVKRGFNGPIFCTAATCDLVAILLRDAAYLQEEQAAHANRYGYTKHRPAEPLYTMEDAEETLSLLVPKAYREYFHVSKGVEAKFRCAGHILGSASVELHIDRRVDQRLAYSGDLGRWGRPILKDPVAIPEADVLIVESTYGNRDHSPDPDADLARIVSETAARGGAVIIPSFAVGRTQELLWRLRQIEADGRIPVLPVYVDSPMAIDVTGIYLRHPEEHDLEMNELISEGETPLRPRMFKAARTTEASKALNDLDGPVIIISASGMATGGRVLHHLKRRLPERRNTVLLAGFQAAGTRGRQLQEGAREIRMHGQEIAVRAAVETLHGLSAHADRSEIKRWLSGFERPPARTYAVHGEEDAAAALVQTIERDLGWRARPAGDGAEVPL